MHAHHNIIVFVINYEINPKIYIFFARHVSWQILDTIKTFLINGCLKASIFFLKMKNLHRTGSKVGFRVSRNWVMDIKKKSCCQNERQSWILCVRRSDSDDAMAYKNSVHSLKWDKWLIKSVVILRSHTISTSDYWCPK